MGGIVGIRKPLRCALTPGHLNLFAFDRVVPRLKTLAGVPPNAFVLRTTGTRMLVPRNRVARQMGRCDLLDCYRGTIEDDVDRVGARGIDGVASDYAADRKGPTLRI